MLKQAIDVSDLELININMRCIEMSVMKIHQARWIEININMRCIEMSNFEKKSLIES